MGCCANRDQRTKEIEKDKIYNTGTSGKNPYINANGIDPSEGKNFEENFEEEHMEMIPPRPVYAISILEPSLSIQSEVLGIKPLSHYKDHYSDKLLSYCDNIRGWIQVKKSENITVEKINTSYYNQDYPLVHATVTFPRLVPLSVVLQQLNDPEHRKIWDNNLQTIEILSGNIFQDHFIYKTTKILLQKFDFVDKVITGSVGESIIIVSHGIDNKKDRVEGYNRGQTTLIVHKITTENNCTVLNTYYQIDAKNTWAKTFAGIEPMKLVDWCKALIKRVVFIISS